MGILLLTVAFGLTGCTSTVSDAEATRVTEEFLGITPEPERVVSTEGQTTAVCVDALGDLMSKVGIDIDSVSLAVQGDYLVATYVMESVRGFRSGSAVPYSSILQATDNSKFSLSVRNPSSGESAQVRVWLNREQKWSMHEARAGVRDDRIEGLFDIEGGMTAVASFPLSALPPQPWIWRAHVVYADNKHEWCPGAAKEAGWLVMP